MRHATTVLTVVISRYGDDGKLIHQELAWEELPTDWESLGILDFISRHVNPVAAYAKMQYHKAMGTK